jgi:hypothetical protein
MSATKSSLCARRKFVQACPCPGLAQLKEESEFVGLLARLKQQEVEYVAAIIRLREQFRSHGRTKADVEEKKAELKVKSKRAYARATMPELAAVLRLVCPCMSHNSSSSSTDVSDNRR